LYIQAPVVYISSLIKTFFKYFVCLGFFIIFGGFLKVNSRGFLQNRMATLVLNYQKAKKLNSQVNFVLCYCTFIYVFVSDTSCISH